MEAKLDKLVMYNKRLAKIVSNEPMETNVGKVVSIMMMNDFSVHTVKVDSLKEIE